MTPRDRDADPDRPPEDRLPSLTVVAIFRGASATFRHRFWRVWGIAGFIAVSASLADTGIDWMADRYTDHAPLLLGVAVVVSSIFLTGANSFGAVFLSGVLDKCVGEHQHGHREVPLREVLRTLPYVTLIVADVIVVIAQGIGFILFIVPGLIVVTLTAITGPISIEGRGAFDAVRRSAQLIGPHFWLAFAVATVPFCLAWGVEIGLDHLEAFHTLFGHAVLGLAIEVPLMTWTALVQVTLAYRLIEWDRPGTISSGRA